MGYILAFFVINVWSLGHLFARMGVVQDFSPLDILLIRYFVSALLFIPFIRHIPIKRIGWKNCVLLSISIGFVYISFSLFSVYFLPGAKAVVIIAGAMPLATVILEKIFFRRHFSFMLYVGLILILTSVILIFIDEYTQTSIARLLAGVSVSLGASFFYAFGLLLTRRHKVNGLELGACVTLPTFVMSVISWIVIHLITNNTRLISILTQEGGIQAIIFQGIYQGIFVGFIGILCVSIIVKKIGNIRFSYFIAAMPIISTFYAPLVGEGVSTLNIIASIICAIGIILANRNINK